MSQLRAVTVSYTDDGGVKMRMEGGQLLDTDSQVSSQPSAASISQPAECSKPPAALPTEALLAFMQALELSNTGPKAYIGSPASMELTWHCF